MDSPFYDGEPSVSSYTSFQYPGPRQQSGPMADFAETEPFSTLPSGFDEQQQQQHLPDTSSFTQAVCHPSRHRSSPSSHHGSDAGAHMTPHSSYQPRNPHVWPSPPLGPGDIQNCFPFQDSPTSGSSTLLPCYTHTPNSPAGWSSPASSFPQSSGLFQQQHPTDSQAYIRICTPTSAKDFPLCRPEISTPYTGSFHQDSEGETCLERPGPSPAMASSLATSSSVGSPDAHHGLRPDTPASMVAIKVEPMQDPSSATDQAAADGVKSDEPYAKLIYRAFMSQPDHSMTLQDIYQWFRENTNKTANEKGGWQNSIRHNLSMNAAFTRRDRKQLGGSGPSSMVEGGSPLALAGGESKRTNEWVLEDWAVHEGVQSTTRYRKGNSGRRPAKCSSTSHPNGGVGQPQRQGANQHSSTRALSGRKGGCAARNSRLRGRQYSQESPMDSAPYRLLEREVDSPPRPGMAGMPGPYFSAVIPVSRLEPAATTSTSTSFAPETTATEPFGLQMTGPRLDQVYVGQGQGQQQQQQHQYLTPSPGEFPYGIADVQLDYSAEHPDSGRLFDALPGSVVGGWDNHHGMPL